VAAGADAFSASGAIWLVSSLVRASVVVRSGAGRHFARFSPWSSHLPSNPGLEVRASASPLAANTARGKLAPLDHRVRGLLADLWQCRDFLKGHNGVVVHLAISVCADIKCRCRAAASMG
jgi:hypothetical protein